MLSSVFGPVKIKACKCPLFRRFARRSRKQRVTELSDEADTPIWCAPTDGAEVSR
jgi:hypothetical protein